MVERAGRGKGKRKLLGSHQKCWLWGRHAVMETLHAGRWIPIELHFAESLPGDLRAEIQNAVSGLDISVIVEPSSRLQQLCGSGEHQGLLAKMPEFPYENVAEVLAERPANPFYVILDGIQDPFNFGAILRSAEVFGVDAVILRESGQVGVTSLVARTSAGAVNHVRIARTDQLDDLIEQLQRSGIRIIAADHTATTPPAEAAFNQPTALLIGSEGTGISESLLPRCDQRIVIPQHGRVGSLNAAVAAGILFYEVTRQRSPSTINHQP